MKKLLGVFIGILIVTILGAYLMRNILIEHLVEKIGSEKYKAKIDVEKVEFNVLKRQIDIKRIEVTDKNNTMRNIVDAKDISIVVEYLPLLKKLIVVEDAKINLLETLTKRSYDGKLKGVKLKNKESLKSEVKVKSSVENLKKLDLNGDDYKEILDTLDLKIVREYNLEKQKLDRIYKYWETKIKKEGYKNKIEALEGKYKVIEKKIKNEKNPIKILNELNNMNELVKSVNNILKDLEKEKKQFKEDLKEVQKTKQKALSYIKSDDYFKDIVGWDEEDLKKEINKLVKNKVQNYIDRDIDLFTSVVDDKSKKELEYDFWLKNLDLNFKYKKYSLKGNAKNLTSKTGIINTPMEIDLKGDDKKALGYLNGKIFQDRKSANIKFKLNNLVIDNDLIDENENLSIIVGSIVDIGYNMTYGKNFFDIKGNVGIDNLNLDLRSLNLDEKVIEVLGDNLNSLEKIIIDYTYNSKEKNLDLENNISALVSTLVKRVLDENLERYKLKGRKLVEVEGKKYKELLGKEVKKIEGLDKLLNLNLKESKDLIKKLKLEKDKKNTKNTEDYLNEGLKKIFN